MAWVRINPRYRQMLRRQGLAQAADFLRLPGVILCGHPNRHVLRVELSRRDPSAEDENCCLAGAILKKEHRVPWRDRIGNALDGFGFVAKSTREATILQRIARAGIPCPEVLAHGADQRRAFLLVREQCGMMDLRLYVQQNPQERLALARALGKELARMHHAGFEHGDLYAKHILVGPGPRFCFLDWQRARFRKRPTWFSRCRDLAALDATVTGSLATDRVRFILWRSYVRNLGLSVADGRTAQRLCTGWANDIRRLSLKLQQKPRIRNLRRMPLPTGAQSLVWLDGASLCVTSAFYAEIGHKVPDWLCFRATTQSSVERSQIALADGRTGTWVKRSAFDLGPWLLSLIRATPTPEVQQAALLFRLERHGVPSPKLLAFGERVARPWGRHSFLLTETPPSEETLADLLAHPSGSLGRGHALRQAGALLRGVHEAGFVLGKQATTFATSCALQKNNRLVLTNVTGLERRSQPWSILAASDLPKLQSHYLLSRTDSLRLLLGYLGTRRLTPEGRGLARALNVKEVAR